jgi:hypothetical protein
MDSAILNIILQIFTLLFLAQSVFSFKMLRSVISSSKIASNRLVTSSRLLSPAVQHINPITSYSSSRSSSRNSYRSRPYTSGVPSLLTIAGVATALTAAMSSSSSAEALTDNEDSFAKTALYPPIKAYNSGMLKVSDLHSIYYSEYGNPNGKPVIFIHGGPGGGTDPFMARYFDPKVYRIVLVDQRGCGLSTPFAELRENTTYGMLLSIVTLYCTLLQ